MGEGSTSAHEPCTELARVQRYWRVGPHLGEWMVGSSIWPGALGQASRWSLLTLHLAPDSSPGSWAASASQTGLLSGKLFWSLFLR